MLVVGDTWCAVTDPLRYHSRVSGLKSWILIVATWFVSILFCIASALRRDCRLITTEITSTFQKITSSGVQNDIEPLLTSSTSSSNRTTITSIIGDSLKFDDIYNLIYSCTFFVVIILIPICLVCAMYWKIFSEARQNGLRMRQNGSSPLLQSALNLATASAHLPPPTHLDHSCSVIGEEDSDNVTDSLASSRSNVIQVALRRNSMAATTTSPVHHVSIKDPHYKSTQSKLHSSANKVNTLMGQSSHRRFLEIPNFHEIQNYQPHMNCNGRNQVSKLNGHDVASDVVEKTHKHLLFEHRIIYDPLTADVANELRQVHSTPDLQKSIQTELSMLAAGHRINGKHSSDKKIHSSGSINKHANTVIPLHTRRPSICTPPKALSYMTSIRHRLSNASSIFKYREESRAARISILVVIMFLFSYFPYGLLVLLQGRATFFANSSCLGVLFLLIANITSPFIFAYRNRRVRRGVCRLFGVDAKTNERLQKQRMIMHGNLRSNSCREQKRKTKVVRINRNSAKSASFSSGCIDQPKYSPVPLIDDASTEHNHQLSNRVESAVCLSDKICNAAVDDVCIAIDEPLFDGDNQPANGFVSSNVMDFITNCTNNNSNCKRDQSDSMDDPSVAKYVKDIVNNINSVHDAKNVNHQSQNRIPIHLNSNNNNNNIHSTSKNANVNSKTHCNLSPTTGANVIKQKISLLRRVCKHSAKKRSASNCSSPTSPCTDSQFYFDSKHSLKAVNV